MDEDVSVGIEAFSRIAPAVPIIANVIVSDYIFEVLAASTSGRLHFLVFDKYLSGLERYYLSSINLYYMGNNYRYASLLLSSFLTSCLLFDCHYLLI